MKKLIFLLLATTNCFSQLYVSPSSYVYANNTYLYVTTDVNLDAPIAATASNFYLRNNSQLLQGASTTARNDGSGRLSVFQEGTVNNFQYNYWCSPIGNSGGNNINNNFGVSLLGQPTTNIVTNAATILPFSGLNGSSDPLNISQRWIYKYITSNAYAQWQFVGNTIGVEPGLGFTMKGTSGSDATIADAVENVSNNAGSKQRYDFRGKPNDGNISNLVSAGNQTLVGNPYASAINLNYFLLENSGYTVNYATGVVTGGGANNVISGTAEFWEHSKTANSHFLINYVGGYGVYTPNNVNANSPGTYVSAPFSTYNGDGTLNTAGAASGNVFERMFSPIGQGFMVNGIASGSVLMKNEYRAYVKEGGANNSVFERNANSVNNVYGTNWETIPNVAQVDYTQFSKAQLPQIKISTILNNAYTREVALAFNPNTTEGYDVAFDGPTSDDTLPVDAYFPLVNSNKQFVINTLPFGVDKRIPFAFKNTEASSFKVKVSQVINFDNNQMVYLFDKTTGIYHDIKNNSFEMNLPTGNVANRFEITFKNTTLSTDDFLENSVTVYQNNIKNVLTINNTSLLDIANVEVFDISGKLVINKKNLGAQNLIEMNTNTFQDGVYLVNLTTVNNLKIVKKVIIKK